jgi:HAD superfamily hydrolase (TIGR01509 family)
MVVKAVIFDLDGTIVAFNIDFKAVRAEVRSFLISIGLPASILSLNESMFEMLKKTEIFMKNHGKSQKSIVEARERAFSIAEKYELEAAKNTSLSPGAVETLKALKKMGLKIGLCTVNGEKSTSFVLKRFKIDEYFNVVVPRDKVKYVKPNSEHLEAVLKALKVKAGEAIVVGDSVMDMKCARELKVTAVGLPTGVSTLKDLISSGANYFITSLADLPSLIEHTGRIPEKQ